MPATTLGSAPSMPATTMMTRAEERRSRCAEHAMDAGDADVVHAIDGVAHHLRGDRGLFGDRLIGGAGGAQRDRALAGRRVALHGDAPRELVILGVRHDAPAPRSTPPHPRE